MCVRCQDGGPRERGQVAVGVLVGERARGRGGAAVGGRRARGPAAAPRRAARRHDALQPTALLYAAGHNTSPVVLNIF